MDIALNDKEKSRERLVEELGELRDQLAAEKKRCRELSQERTRMKPKELPEIECRYRRLFDSMQEGFMLAEIILDKAGNPYDCRLLEVNEAFGRLTGFPPEVANGRTARDLVPSVDPHWFDIFGGVAFGGKPEQFEAKSAFLNKWFQVYAFSPERGKFGLMFIDITSRKRVEEDLREAQRRTSEILESITDAFYAVDADWRLTYVNKKTEALWGRSREELVGTVLWSLFPNYPEMRGYREHLRAMKERTPVNFEAFSPNLHFWADVNIYPTADGGLSVYFRDITDRKKVEEALHESEKKYRAIVETAQEGIIITKPEGNFVFVNQKMADMLGYPVDEILGKSITDFCDEDQLEKVLKTRKDLENHENVRGEIKLRRKDGSFFWTLYSASPLFDSEGRYIGNLALHTDITKRKEAIHALRESEERFRALLTASSEVLYRMSPDWSEMRQLHSRGFLANTERPNRNWLQEYIHPDDQPHVSAVFNEAIRTKSIFELEHRVRRADGSLGWTSSRAVPLLDANGEIVEWFGAASDITERRQAEENLRKLNGTLEQRVTERTELAESRAKQLRALASELTLSEQRERRRLAEILHDHLQQLLVAARINFEVLSAQIGTDQKKTSENILNLITQSIQISRSLTAELSPPVLHQGRLSAALEWLARWMQEKHGLTVELQTDPGMDPEREDITILLFQSARELLFNVVKHAKVKSARLEMVRDKENRLRVTVIDQGPGFDPATIWEKAQDGTGFGLLSIRERLTLLGGSLEIESSPGEWAVFSLLVPVEITREKEEDRIKKNQCDEMVESWQK